MSFGFGAGQSSPRRENGQGVPPMGVVRGERNASPADYQSRTTEMVKVYLRWGLSGGEADSPPDFDEWA